ncbi:MAG: winged helix-turn-helix transcriptional regulator [Ruegeria sp.]|uniref:winged helix-turn-helix transcriptional regulator n=1 Tax=Ruegeria sp. TaxID=1879320 RepID=UPI00349ED127
MKSEPEVSMLPVGVNNKAEASNCSIRSVLSNVTGKWRMIIILALEDEPKRFGAIKRCIGDVTQRVLTENLRGLQRDGYLTRTVDPGPPVAVSYELTPLGRSLLELLKPLVFWSHEQMEHVKTARMEYERSQSK